MLKWFDLGKKQQSDAPMDMLQAAGFNLRDKHQQTMGLVAYNAAFMVWEAYAKRRAPSSPKAGRNAPCPCGSGDKYKKCCMAADQVNASTPAPRGEIPFGADLIPRLSSGKTVIGDLEMLDKLLESDAALKKLRFSSTKLEAFLVRTLGSAPLPDEAMSPEEMEELAARYASESGEVKLIESAKDRFLEVAPRARTAAELRALGLGICFSLICGIGRVENNSKNPLTSTLFRLSIRDHFDARDFLRRVMSKLGDKKVMVERLRAGDPALSRQVEQIIVALSPAERANLERESEALGEELWDAIAKGQLPVTLPFATLLPFIFMTLNLKGTRPSRSELDEILSAHAERFTSEDSRLFAELLDAWLDGPSSKGADKALMKTIRKISSLAKVNGLVSFVPDLLGMSIRRKAFSYFDGEQAVVETWNFTPDDRVFLDHYAGWIDARGYPGIAERTRNLAEGTNAMG